MSYTFWSATAIRLVKNIVQYWCSAAFGLNLHIPKCWDSEAKNVPNRSQKGRVIDVAKTIPKYDFGYLKSLARQIPEEKY